MYWLLWWQIVWTFIVALHETVPDRQTTLNTDNSEDDLENDPDYEPESSTAASSCTGKFATNRVDTIYINYRQQDVLHILKLVWIHNISIYSSGSECSF